MTAPALVRCLRPCGWQGPVDDARTGNTHTVGTTVVHEYRCPVCGDRVKMPMELAP